MKTKPARRFRFVSVPVLVALVLILTAGVVFAGVFGHRIQELTMPDKSTDMISLQGYTDSPEYKASAEWKDFEDGYDQDESILDAVGNDPTPWDEKYNYNGYLVYSQEMADKTDEIIEKYGLKLHTGGITAADLDQLCDMFGDFVSGADGSGYYYKDGTFHYDGDATIEGRQIEYQLRRTMKGVFDTVCLNVGDADKYEQWEYETSCGETVLLALSDDKALIITDYDNCFILVNVLCGTDKPFVGGGDTITKESLETLADSFNFSVLSGGEFSPDESAAEPDEDADEQTAEAEASDPDFRFECNPIDDPDAVITKRFGNVSGKEHEGIDFAADEGTAIHAVADGNAKVWEADNDLGNYVIINHNNGWCTVYAHCETILVEDGASVKAGDEIATVGSTGTSSGPHLHFELRGSQCGPVDPEPYFNR
ncbi:MAG: M23 family metallopeptidase [Bacillota bacterium]